MIPKPAEEVMPNDSRQKAALGVQEDTAAIRDAPICRGNSQICKFIACSAHNFKHDQNFANLNLAAQLVSDPKMRKTITNNPEAVISVCREQGLSESQCKMFSQGFQVIDKFFNVVEPKNGGEIVEDTTEMMIMAPSSPASPSISQNKLFEMSDDPNPIAAHISRNVRPISRTFSQGIMGSRTWSTHINPVLSSSDSLIPRPIIPMGNVGGAGINHHTTEKKTTYSNSQISTTPIQVPTAHLPTSPIVPVIQRPFAKPPPQLSMNNPSNFSTATVISRPKRLAEILNPREKRDTDYYDQMPQSTHSTSQTKSRVNNPSSTSDDYYDNIDATESIRPSSVSSSRRKSTFTPLNCFHILG
uniref:Uncharacterized protein n=1 Tax=Panagrolaimus davidi TaxID=227884 RepID=A0A914P747_9BILA